MSTSALITSRDRKGLHAVKFFEVAYNKAKLDEEQAQRLNERGGELQDSILNIIKELSDRYCQEEVESNRGYVLGLGSQARNLSEQISILKQYFAGLCFKAKIFSQEKSLPEGAEGWFAIPRWENIAPTYCEALRIVLRALSESRGSGFVNANKECFGPEFIRSHGPSTEKWSEIGRQQAENSILLVPAQLGILHGGRSVRRARELMSANQFGLGAFATAIILLTHPERLQEDEILGIDCAGDEYSPWDDSAFEHSPLFYFDRKLVFGHRHASVPRQIYGSATGFIQ